MATRIPRLLALLSTGLLAGAFTYATLNVLPTFGRVPLDVHLPFRVELMSANSLVIQSLIAAAFATACWLAVVSRGLPRVLAAGSGALVAATFLVTRFGNVPVNQKIRTWDPAAPPAGYADLLQRWDAFHGVRTATAVLAFVVMLVLVDRVSTRRAAVTA